MGEDFDLPIAFSQSKGTAVVGLAADGAETFSNDSAILAVSKSVILLSASKVNEGGLEHVLRFCISTLLPSDESETE